MFKFKKTESETPQQFFTAFFRDDRDPNAEATPDMRQGSAIADEERWRLDLRRINLRAVLILLGLSILAVVLYFPITSLQDGYLRRSALAQAQQFAEAGQTDQALTIMDRYLNHWPEDLVGLAYHGELVTKYAGSYFQITSGVKSLEQLLRLDPDSPGRQEDRKRLVELMVRQGDIVLAGTVNSPGVAKQENLYRAANLIAEERIKLGLDDAESHRLLAITLERLSVAGDTQSMPLAIKEYQKALRRDPGDYQSADRLATLRLDLRKDQAGADQILDDLIKARPRMVEARLVRARHFLKTNREERSKVELEAAARLSPTASGVRMMASSLAIRRGDIAAARRHLEAIPKEERDNPRVALLAGQIELADHHTEEGIDKWRKGLIATAGTDLALNWRLAFTLIRLGRANEARPLMDRYRRLVRRDDHPMLVFLEGFLKDRAGKHSAAIADLKTIREDVEPEWKSELEMMLGRCYQMTGNVKEAEVAYIKVTGLQPNWPAPRVALARLLADSSPKVAEEQLEEGLKLAKGINDAALHAARVRLYLARQMALPEADRNWSEVKAALDRGQKTAAGQPELAQAAVEYLIAAKQPDQALTSLEESTRGPGRTREEAWLARAGLLAQLGRPDDAVAVLEEAANPKNAGDQAAFRVTRSTILLRSGKGRSALECLTRGIERLPVTDRARLAQAKADVLFSLGDRAGARATCQEWAELAPEESGPGLKLIDMAKKGGTADDSELGIELLRKAGGEDEPNALAARALALLDNGTKADEEVNSTNLDEAEVVVQRLKEVAPDLPVSSFVQGLLLERTRSYEEAIAEYKVAIKKDPKGQAMPRLVALLTHLKRPNEIALLKTETKSADLIDRLAVGAAAESGDQEQAEAILEELVKAQPDSLEYRASLSKMLLKMGKPEQASETLKALTDRQPERPQPWLALLSTQLTQGDKPGAASTIDRLKKTYKGKRPDLLLARCLWAFGDVKGATQIVDESLAKNPNDLETIQAASQLADQAGALDRSEALLRQALKLDPKASWASQKLALLIVNRPGASRWSEAWSLVAPASTTQAENPEVRLTRAIVLQSCPDPKQQAEAPNLLANLIDDLPSTNPVAFQARIRLARLLMTTRDFAGATKAIAPVSADPAINDPAILLLAIDAMVNSGKTGEARQRLDRLTQVDPNSPSTIASRALLLKAEGDPEGAVSAIEEAAVVAEKAAEADRLNMYYFGQLVRLGFDDAAHRMGQKISDRWPRQAWVWGRFQADRDKIDDALESCRIAADAGANLEPLKLIAALVARDKLNASQGDKAKTIALSIGIKDGRNNDLLSLSAWILRRQSRFEDESRLYRQVLESDPSNMQARNNLAWVLGENLGHPAEGLVEVDKVIRQSGISPQTGDTRGVILTRLGRFDEAIAELERATRTDPSTIHYLHLSRALAGKGRAEEARKALQDARKALKDPRSLDPADLAEVVAASGR